MFLREDKAEDDPQDNQESKLQPRWVNTQHIINMSEELIKLTAIVNQGTNCSY